MSDPFVVPRRRFLQGVSAAVGLAALPLDSSRADGPGDALSQGRWLAGDTHVHTDHSSDGSFTRQAYQQLGPGNVSVADQIDQGERIGLDWMPITDHRSYDQHWDPLWTSDSLLLVPGEEANGAPHAICLGAVDVVVDGANPPGSASHRHIQQSIWEAHAQDAAWSTAHPDTVSPDNLSALGPDVIEVWNRASIPDTEIDFAEDRWNHGFRSGVVGGCDCHFRELWGIAGPGQPTTWVFARDLSERAILDGLRAGRTSIALSPLGIFVTLEADLDGDGRYEALGGDEVLAPSGTKGTLRVRVQRGAGSTLLIHQSPGRSVAPLATLTITGLDETHVVPITVPAGQTWWRAELRGLDEPAGISTQPAENTPKRPNQLQALTAPLFASGSGPAVPAPALPLPDVAGDDRGAVVLGELGTFTGFADVAVGKQGAHVVAEEHRDGRTDVVYLSPKGNRTVLASGGARMPKVAVDGNKVWVAWQDERGGQLPRNPQVYLRHSKNGGQTWDPEQRLSDGRGRQERVALALLPDGTPVVAWQAATGSAVDVHAVVVGVDSAPVNVSAAGKVVDPGSPADTRSARFPASLFPDVAVLPDGTAVVSWQDDRHDPDPLFTGHTPTPPEPQHGGTDPDAWEPMVATRKPGTTSWATPVRVAVRADRAQCHPALGAAADGTLVCAWDSRRLSSSGANATIVAATSRDGGATWSAPSEIDPAPDFFAQRPRLAPDPDGTIRVVWYDSRSSDWRWQVRSARLVGGGWQLDGTVLAAGNNTWPGLDCGAVVATSDRGALIQRDRTQRIVLRQLVV